MKFTELMDWAYSQPKPKPPQIGEFRIVPLRDSLKFSLQRWQPRYETAAQAEAAYYAQVISYALMKCAGDISKEAIAEAVERDTTPKWQSLGVYATEQEAEGALRASIVGIRRFDADGIEILI